MRNAFDVLLPITPINTKRFWINLPDRIGRRIRFYRARTLSECGGNLLLFLGHHKCASQFIARVLFGFARDLNIRLFSAVSPRQFHFDADNFIQKLNIKMFLYQNADKRYLPQTIPFCGFHVIRDPRDVIVSSYYSHLHSHLTDGWPELVGHRAHLRRLSAEEGLLAEMEFSSRLPTRGVDLEPLAAMRDWDYTDPRIMEVRFEHLTHEPVALFRNVFQFFIDNELRADLREDYRAVLQRQDPAVAAKRLVDRFNFQRLSGGRAPGKVNESSHYRSGKSGQWREIFNDEHKKRFKELYGDVVVRTGYAASNDW